MRANMLFWPVVVLSLVSFSLYLVGPPSGGLLHQEDAELRRVYLIVLAAGITIAAAGRLLLRGGSRTARQAIIWFGVFAGLSIVYSERVEINSLYERARGNLMPSVALTTAQGEAELHRAWDGHYRAEAEINGIPIRLMIDTGASMVLLPYDKATEIGLDPNQLEFSQPVSTANGKSSVAPIRLSSVKVGPIVVFDVPAAVAQPGRLRVGLLGMSFLDELSETSFQGDKLILRH